MELLRISRAETSSPLLNYYKIIFIFGNYLFLIPFRFMKKGEVHIVTSNRIHQVPFQPYLRIASLTTFSIAESFRFVGRYVDKQQFSSILVLYSNAYNRFVAASSKP